MRDVIPDPIFHSIQEHIERVSNSAHSAWPSGKSEEDTLTGDFCSRLSTEWTSSAADGHRWMWRVRYKKFRGRGKNPFEKRSGADGIVQVEATLAPMGVRVFKGLLFQAKKNLSGPNMKTQEQVRAMEKIAPGGSALFVYASDRYRALSGASYLKQADGVTIPDLGPFLARSFLPCKTGLRGMYFDAVRELLLIPIGNGDVRAMPVELRHRVFIEARELG